MKQILVPIDFSSDSINALEHAIVLANFLNFDIRLIHVKRLNADYDSSFNLHDFDEVLKSGIIEKIEKITNQYKDELKGKFDYKIRDGRIYNEICNQAKYGDSELIVMGTHGVSGFEERWVGSNAFRVVSHASSPVITIRYNFPKRVIKRIVLPIDTTDETRKKVPFIASLAKLLGAEILVVDVRENNKIATRKKLNEYVAQVVTYLARKKIKYQRDSFKGSNMADVIIEYALICDADLIGVMTEQSERSKGKWIGRYAQYLVNHSPIPILSIKPY